MNPNDAPEAQIVTRLHEAEREVKRITRDLAHLRAAYQESERQRVESLMAATRLEQERDEARAKLAEVERKLGQVSEGWKQKDAALYEANARLRLVEVEPDLAWRWQGDGHDDPASLTCPVIMAADTLRGFVADRAKVAALEAQLAAAPSGLRVAALKRRLRNAMAEAWIVAGKGDDPETRAELAGEGHGLRHALVMVKEHLGNPTPGERAAAEVLAHDASDIIPSDAPRILDEIAMEIEQAREYLGFARADRAGYRIARIARLALAGIVACDAKGGA